MLHPENHQDGHALSVTVEPVQEEREKLVKADLAPTPIKSIVLQICSGKTRIERAQIDEFFLGLLMKGFTLESWSRLHELTPRLKIYELSLSHYSCPVQDKLAVNDEEISEEDSLEAPQCAISSTEILQLTPQTKIMMISDEYHAILVLDFSRSVLSVGERVQIETLFKKLYEFWSMLCKISILLSVKIYVSILLDLGATDNSPVYVSCHLASEHSDFRIIVDKLAPYLPPLQKSFPPSELSHLLSCALQCSTYLKSGSTFVILFTNGILDKCQLPMYTIKTRKFTALNIPIHVCVLDTNVSCFGFVPEIEVLQHIAHSSGGHCFSEFDFKLTFFEDHSYVRSLQKHFSFEILPLSNAQLAFPWDPTVSLPIVCIPTRYRDYEVSFPMDVIKARLRQGFMIQNALSKSKITIQLVLYFFPEVCLHYRLKVAPDWSFARVEINVLAFSEFTMNLFKHPSHSSMTSEDSAFQEFLRSVVDQDLVYKVMMEVGNNLIGSPLSENKETYVQLIETLLKSHLDWMDQETLYFCGSEETFIQIMEQWSTFCISDHYVYLNPNASIFSFTAIRRRECTSQHFSCTARYYKCKTLPNEFENLFAYEGAVSVMHGPQAQVNRLLLKQTSHVYSVSPDLSLEMATISLEHFSALGYRVLRTTSNSVDMVLENLQSTVSFYDNAMSIDTYQVPNLGMIEINELTDILSAMYTLDGLLHRNIPEADPLFSIHNLLVHSKCTILGLYNKVTLPVHAFAKALRKHIADICMDPQQLSVLDLGSFHRAIHEWHALATPECSQFDCYIYITSDSALIFHLPRHTNVPYVVVFECIMNRMSLHAWNAIELSPHSLAPLQSIYPMVTSFYYTSHHITTENIDLFLCDCAWQTAVECIYTLSDQLDPAHVEMCILRLSTWNVTLDISLLICLFELLRFDSSKDHLELIDKECARFNDCLYNFMRIIPKTQYFTLLEPFIFASMTCIQTETNAMRITSCPDSPPAAHDYTEEQKQNMLVNYTYPFKLKLLLSLYALERDVANASTIAHSMATALENMIKHIILNLFLAIQPVSERILEIILLELNILSKSDFHLNVLKSAPVTLLRTELEQFDFKDYTTISVGNYLLLFAKMPCSSQEHLDPMHPSTLDSEQAKELEEGFGILLHDDKPTASELVKRAPRQKEWIILSVAKNVLHVYSNVDSISKIFQPMLPKFCKIVNTRVLLNNLRDTHSSSRYLIPLDNMAREIQTSTDKDVKDTEEPLDASPGDFACPVQFSFSFPIHWRLKPMVSLNSVSSSLHALAVMNRAHTFVVISPEDNVYYMRLCEISNNSSANSLLATPAPGGDEEMTPNPSPCATPFSITRCLLLELHGLDIPSKEFSNEVVNMVSSRLSNVILQHLSTYLSRTSLSRLTPADVHFLLPIFRGPRATFLLSDVAVNIGDEASILYFRQSLLTFTSVLSSSDVVATISQHLQYKYGIFVNSQATYDVSPFDMAFLYCSIASRSPTLLETAIGQGIACLLLYLAQEGKPCLHPATNQPVHWMLEFWTHGTIHTEALLQKVKLCQQQSQHDLKIESELKNGMVMDVLKTLVHSSPDFYSCLLVHRLPIRISTWKQPHFLDYIQINIPELTFKRDENFILCLMPSSQAQAWCYYSSFVHQWNCDKLVKENVDRHFLLYVEVCEACILSVCWNTKHLLLEKLQTCLDSYVQSYVHHMEELKQMTFYKMGFGDFSVENVTTQEAQTVTEAEKITESTHPVPEKMLLEYRRAKQLYEIPHSKIQVPPHLAIPWAARFCAQKGVLDASEIEALQNQSELVYWCRVPLFFNCALNEELFVYSPLPVIQPDHLKASIRVVLEEFMSKFREHVISLGFELVHTREDASSFQLTHELHLPTPYLYFQKVAYPGCVLLEVTIEKYFLKVHFFTYVASPTPTTATMTTTTHQHQHQHQHHSIIKSPPTIISPTNTTAAGSPHGRGLVPKHQHLPYFEMCYTLRQGLRVDAFVYDFHLRIIAGVIRQSLPVPYNLIHVLHELHKRKAPKEARSQLCHGTVTHPHAHIVSYLFSHPLRFKLGLVCAATNACYISLNETQPSSLLVMRQVPVGIEYFIIDTAPPALPFLSNITRKAPEAKAAIEKITERASWYYERERLWQSLLESHDVEISEILKLARNFFCSSLITLDPEIHILLSLPADWQEISKMLSADWPFGLKTIGKGAEKLLMFLNQDDSALYLISFSPPHVTLVIRDDEDKKHIGSLVSIFVVTLSRVLWRHLNVIYLRQYA